MSEPTCRTCWIASLHAGDRERVLSEPVTGCVYHCPEHKKDWDDLMARIPFLPLIERKPGPTRFTPESSP